MLITGLSVLIGAILNVVVARQGVTRLGERSNREIEGSLNEANSEYLTNHINDKALHANEALEHAYADLRLLASVVQKMIDQGEELGPVLDKIATLPSYKDNITYNPKTNWYQNGREEPTVVSVWGYLGENGALRPEVKKAVDSTALLDLILPAFREYGAKKSQIYYIGPKESPYLRFAPNIDLAGTFDEAKPNHNKKNFYDFWYPGLVEGWQQWLKTPERLKAHENQITVTAPYDDGGGGGLIMTAFHPLWSKDRAAYAGSVALDLTLKQIIESVKDVKLAQTGFAFLTQADGNVLAVNDAGAAKLGLQSSTAKGSGVDILKRFLKESKEPTIASLSLPQDDKVAYYDMMIADEPHIVVLERLPAPALVFRDEQIQQTPEYWTLGFVVPRNEMYASLIAAQKAIEQTRGSIVKSQAVIAVASFLVLMLAVYLVARRMTGALVALSSGATRMRKGDYSVRVDVSSEDEIGQLGVVFNDMANEIQAYTTNLEEIVRARTKALEDANQEITALNAKLAQENLRLGAELDVARQLQLMVLPADRELDEIPALDIAGYMKPADEVGGDYYDVLRNNGMVKIGIGDVTGHGLESGVLMLMVQTAVRTLLASNEMDPRRFLNIVNKVVYQNAQRIKTDKNLTLSLMDYQDGVLKLTGQHEEVIIVRSDGRLERVDTTGLGLPIGLELDISEFISNIELQIDPGDVVALFTDGITEAEDVKTQQYGMQRLCDVIMRNHTRTSEQIKESIINDVMSHIGENKIYDDITVLVIKRL